MKRKHIRLKSPSRPGSLSHPGSPSRLESLTHLSSLTPSRRNPREITTQNLVRLIRSIESFGDISGIVYNKRTKELVCGHQRVTALLEQFGDLKIEENANGRPSIVLPSGESYEVRVVNWTPEQQDAAMVAANSPTTQGTFTSGLGAILYDLEKQVPNVFEALGFASLQPHRIPSPESWERPGEWEGEGGPESHNAPLWKDSTEAREGKALSESIADDVKLEARFELRVPEKLAKRASKLLMDLVKQLKGATAKRLD